MISQFPVITKEAGATLNTGATATLSSTGVDCRGFDYITITVLLGTIAAGGGLSVAKLQYSDNNSTWADVTDGGATPLPGDTDDNKYITWYHKNVDGAHRYYRVVLTTAGAVNTIIDSIIYARSRAQIVPPSTSSTVLAINLT